MDVWHWWRKQIRDDRDKCEWVNVSSHTVSPGLLLVLLLLQNPESCKTGVCVCACACVCVCMRLDLPFWFTFLVPAYQVVLEKWPCSNSSTRFNLLVLMTGASKAADE